MCPAKIILLCLIAALLGGCTGIVLESGMPKTGGDYYQSAQTRINGDGTQRK